MSVQNEGHAGNLIIELIHVLNLHRCERRVRLCCISRARKCFWRRKLFPANHRHWHAGGGREGRWGSRHRGWRTGPLTFQNVTWGVHLGRRIRGRRTGVRGCGPIGWPSIRRRRMRRDWRWPSRDVRRMAGRVWRRRAGGRDWGRGARDICRMVRRSSPGDRLSRGPAAVGRGRSSGGLSKGPTIRRSGPRNWLSRRSTVWRSGPRNRLSRRSTVRRGSPGNGIWCTWIVGEILRARIWRSRVCGLTIRGSRSRGCVASGGGIASSSTRRTITGSAFSSAGRVLPSTSSGCSGCIDCGPSVSIEIEIIEPAIEVTRNTGGAVRVSVGRSVGWRNARIVVETATAFPLYYYISIFSIFFELLGQASNGFFLLPLPALLL